MKKENKIVARVFGGLGNQMFIYAAARNLSLKTGLPIYLDVSSGFINDIYKRRYSLQHFNIKAAQADDFESYMGLVGKLRRIIDRKWNPKYIVENKNRCFRPIPENMENYYLEGFWQSPKYFEENQEAIRSDFSFADRLPEECISLAKNFNKVNSVSLHFRSYKEVPKRHSPNVLSSSYYLQAIERIKEKVENPVFYCFSDDISWAKKTISSDNIVFVDITFKGEVPAELQEMWLMSNCKHHIIANSTFSWWGAWLNSRQDKIVITPDLTWNNSDIIPADWIKLSI
jgi:hypothetical protein